MVLSYKLLLLNNVQKTSLQAHVHIIKYVFIDPENNHKKYDQRVTNNFI